MYRSESFFPSESYEMTSWLVSIDRRSKIIQRSVTFNRGRLSFPKRRLIPIDLISGYYAKRMAENDTRIIVTAFTLPPIPIYVDIWHMGNLNGAWNMDAFSVVSNVTGPNVPPRRVQVYAANKRKLPGAFQSEHLASLEHAGPSPFTPHNSRSYDNLAREQRLKTDCSLLL